MVFALAIFANAEDATFDVNAKDVVYIEGVLQTGVEGNLSIMLKNSSKAVGTITYVFSMPEGVSMNVNAEGDVEDIVTDGSFVCHQQPDGSFKLSINYGKTWGVSTTARSIASIPVNCSASVGEYYIEATSAQVIFADNTGVDFADFSTTVTVQKAAVIEELGDGYSILVVPATMNAGYYADGNGTTMDIYYTSPKELVAMSFDIEFPSDEIYSTTDPVIAPEINNSIVTGTPGTPITITPTGDHSLNVKFEGVRSSRNSKSYLNVAANDPVKIATITIESEESLADGFYDIAIKNISVEEYNGGNSGTIHNGNNYSTLVVGKPEVTDPIIYGYMTPEAATKIAKTGDYSVVDMSPATVVDMSTYSDICKAFEALVYHGGFSMYFRSLKDGKSYGTMCVPFDMETDDAATFYTLKSINENTMVFELADKVPAGTPALFEGVLQCDAYEYVKLGTPGSVNAGGTVMKGTYETYDLAAGAGYYISNGKFYSDGAKVKPFRAYFDGVVAGVKSFSVQIETANGIIDITDKLSAEDIYSLQGIKMNKTQKGVNIVGGKKIYVK